MGRSPCCEQDSGVKKGPWTPEEDEKLLDYVTKHGHGSWRTLAKRAGLNRCGKSCRLRWANYLRPDIKRGKFTEEEERIIINLHSVLGNKWSKIASNLPGRTDNEIKNFWNTSIRKKLMKMGIDPETHKPRTDFNHLMNLTQLLGMSSNLGNWGNPLIGGDHVTQQLAKLQLLQNMLAVMNSSTNNSFVNNMGNPNYLLGNPSFNPLINSYLNNVGPNTLQAMPPMDPPAGGGVFSQALSDSSQQWTNVMEGGLNTQDVHDYNKIIRSNNSHEYQLPALVASTSSGNGTFNQMDYSSCNNTAQASTESPSNDFFEDWEKFLEDETNGSYWKEILDLTSTSASPNSW